MDIPRQMGRSGAEVDRRAVLHAAAAIEHASSRRPTATCSPEPDTAFGPDALTMAKTTFRKQKAGPGNKAKDQKPINIRPEFLVVPVEIETDAELLMGSAQLMIDASGYADQDPGRQPSPQQVSRHFNAALVGQLLPGSQRQGLVPVRQSQCTAGVRDRVPQWSSHAGHRTR